MAEYNSKIEKESTVAEMISQGGILSTSQAIAATLHLVKFIDNLHTQGNIHRQICADKVQINKENFPTLEPIKQEITIGGIGVDIIPFPGQLHNIPPLSLPANIPAAQDVLTKAGILLDPRQIDFYQIGALLCFMVSGHSVSDYLRSCKAKADVPEVIRPIVDRALGLNTNNCFCSSVAFAAALESAAEGNTGSAGLPKSIFIAPPTKLQTEGQLPFKKLGHYEIIEHIGHGGMGDVYKGYDKELDRFAAIKVLPAELARQKDFVKRFHAEATAIAKLDHPNIVRIYYSGQDEGYHFFAMQYIDGQSLADLLKCSKKLSTAEALPIIKQALAGIGAAHKSNLIHRDIKPGNILLDRHSRRALITDFGVVKSAQTSTQITVTGAIMGTADYIAPEQARGAEVDCRTDLYAMGVLMYQMLSGQLPFEAKSATSMMFQHAYETPVPLSQIVPDVPEKLAEIVMKLMAKDAGERFQSADDVLTALQNLDFKGEKTASTLQPDFNEDSDCYSSPELSANLSKLTGKNLFDRLRNWFTDFFGSHASQFIEYMHTTTQQVDSAVAEYQRQRDKLAELANEAETAAAELQAQANASRKAAEIAGEKADAAKSTTAKQHALEEKQQCQQAADELAQLAAEQSQQAEEISLRLAKLNAKLAQLRSQQGALNARLNAAKARIKTDQPISSKWYLSKQLINTAIIGILLGFTVLLLYFIWPRPGFARLENIQGNLAILEFKNDIRAYSNRKYVWKTIPDDFPLKAFVQVPGGGKGPVTADVTKSGYVYIVLGSVGDGWQKTPYTINYTDSGFTKLCVYRKFVKKGKFTVNRLGWGGPILLLPDKPVVLPDKQEITFVSIDDPGFKGQMSKYEITNAQYCPFLNAALASGDIDINANNVRGTSGSNKGQDFVKKNYYLLGGSGWTGDGAIDGGKSRISYSDGKFTVEKGFENHPVTYVSWYGAAAFCNYYGYRLPTERQWQAVADYDGSYIIGCGTSINNKVANYKGSVHPYGTTQVGAFGAYGHGLCDMAGNVWEWTSSIYSGTLRSVRGGSWDKSEGNCYVAARGRLYPHQQSERLGFRVCRSTPSGPLLAAHWKFDEGSGDIAHDSTGSNNGTIHGAKWIKGGFGSALEFDGKNSYTHILAGDGSIFDFGAGNFTLLAWIKINPDCSGTIIASPGKEPQPMDNYRLDVLSTGQIQFQYATFDLESITSPLKYNDGQWHQIIALRDNVKTGKLYIDNILVVADVINAGRRYTTININDDLYIGCYKPGNNNLKGLVGEVQVYNYVLSLEEIQQLYESQAGIYQQPTLQKASETVAYIISFKSKPPVEAYTAKELLNAFDNRHLQGTKIHHFRTEIKDGKLIGHICVDNKTDQTTLVNLLAKNDKLILVGTRMVNKKEFEEYCRLGQPSLSILPITFVSIDDPGFKGQMSKYETTNAQYARFLNEAIASGDIIVDGNYVKGASGSNAGMDFVGQNYYQLDGQGSNSIGATARINFLGNMFTVDRGFENHPVTYVSWYGATAFASYYRWRLPSESEWQAVADYDGSYKYGCGLTINYNIANYIGSEHPHGTRNVGEFGVYGYGLADMAGNVREWTSSVYGRERVVRGGSWTNYNYICLVSKQLAYSPSGMYDRQGFRVCIQTIINQQPTVPSDSITYREFHESRNLAFNKLSRPGQILLLPDKSKSTILPISFVSIDDPGFKGQMSKYETTNAQYCQFLNEAKVKGLIKVYNNTVYRTADVTYAEPYLVTYEKDSDCQITYSGDTFTVRFRGGYSMNNYPVCEVSWYGAKAFCDFYGFRLPTDSEWQAVADFDGSYIYGCGTTIDHTKANYGNFNPMGFSRSPYSTPVDFYPAYGYGLCDMAGNSWEWTNSVFGTYRTICGGSCLNFHDRSAVSFQASNEPTTMIENIGFRVCRD